MKNKKILILSNSKDATSDYLYKTLKNVHIPVTRFDTDKISLKCDLCINENDSSITIREEKISMNKIKKLVYRRPLPIKLNEGLCIPERNHLNQEFTGALECLFNCIEKNNWINHPRSNVMASNKVNLLLLARALMIKTPNWILSSSKKALIKFYKDNNENVIVKPIVSGVITRDTCDSSAIYTNIFNDLENLNSVIIPPVIMQEKIEKYLDVRITVIGKKMLAVGLFSDVNYHIDIRYDNMSNIKYQIIEIPTGIKNKVNELMSVLDLKFGAIDFVIDTSGHWLFLEINPNGQWAWMDEAVDFKISEMFVDFFQSA